MTSRAFPKWLVYIGWIIYPFALGLVLVSLYEKTYLTWTRGPQMIGFTMVHVYPIPVLIGTLAFFLSRLWILVAVIFLIRFRASIIRSDWIQFGIIIFTIGFDYVPVAAWQNIIGFFLGSSQ